MTRTKDVTPVHALQEIPNVGPAIARDLLRLGMTSRADLAGQDPDALYARLCEMDGVRHDPCVLDTFTAVVAYANGEPAQPWWFFSRQRKARERDTSPVAVDQGDENAIFSVVCSTTERGRTCQVRA